MSNDQTYVRVRSWNPETDTITEVNRTLEEIVENPVHLNMADIGLFLLNRERESRGLEALPLEAVAGRV